MIGHEGPGTVTFEDVRFSLPSGHIWIEGTRPTACRSCGAAMLFVTRLATGKQVPLNPDGTSHFTTCPQARSWSRHSARQAVTPAPADANATEAPVTASGASEGPPA